MKYFGRDARATPLWKCRGWRNSLRLATRRGHGWLTTCHTKNRPHGAMKTERPTPPPLPAYLRVQPDGLWLAVKVQPRASVNEIGEPLGNELRVKVSAPPVDSAANEAVARLLAERLDCARNQIELVRGHASRHKVIKLRGLSTAIVIARLNPPAS